MGFEWSSLAPLGVGVARSLSGWGENALSDGKVTAFELQQLFSTIFRTALVSFGLMWGMDLGPVSASASAFVLDFVLSKLQKRK